MLARFFIRLINAQAGWARPFGDFNNRWLSAVFRPLRFLKDFLNGKWLGHPVHGALTDLPIGILTLAIVFDVLDMRQAADISVALGVLAILGAAVAGLADYTDTDGHPRMVATVHATLMVVALIVYLVSLVMRLGAPADRTVPIVLGIVAYLVLTAGAYVGGEIVYAFGNMVSRHAWRFWAQPKWQALDVTDIPEGVPTKAKAGAQSLLLVRQGDTIHALHDVCAHAGGILSEGRIVDDCIECPLHQSRYELSTGHKKAGPTTYDQPRFEVRRTAGGGYEALRVTGGPPIEAGG
jgi:nitrite reductase/ring-hydroxylating ferredoxin subunit/uncharacterized membrane protein